MRNMTRLSTALAAIASGALIAACEGGAPTAETQQSPAAEPAATAEESRAAILRLEREWTVALSRKDLAWYDRHVAPEYRTILSSGRVLPRAGVIETVRDSPPAQDVKLEQADVRIFGDTAVAVVTQSFTMADGKPGRLRMTDVWRRSGGRWMAVHSHETALGPEQAS